MRFSQVRGRRSAWHTRTYLNVFTIGLTLLIMVGSAVADELETCMTRMLLRSSDSTTVGEIRSRCTDQIQAGTQTEQDNQPAVVIDRLEVDRKHVLQPFSIMAHKPNYFLAAAYNSKGYDAMIVVNQALTVTVEILDVPF